MTINTVKLWGIGVTLAALAAYFAFDRYTRWGLAIQATAADEEATLSAGVPVRRVHACTWALAGALATLGGLFLAGFPGAPQPALGDAALRAFPAIVLGGLGSPVGAVVGGVLIGVVEVLTSGYAPDVARHELPRRRAVHRDDRDPAGPALRPVRRRVRWSASDARPSLPRRARRSRCWRCRSSSGRRR